MTRDMSTTIESVTERDLRLPGGDVHYAEAGAGDALVMIHGYAPMSTWRVWASNIRALASARRVLALDLPGYGKSPEPDGGRPSDFAEWFATYMETVRIFIQALSLERVALCGLSAGGGVALSLSAEHPDLVQRLVLVDSAGAEMGDRWKAIQAPTLIIWQREDRIVPVDHGERLHTSIAGSRLEVFDGNAAGIDPQEWHWAHALNPDRFNELAVGFLT